MYDIPKFVQVPDPRFSHLCVTESGNVWSRLRNRELSGRVDRWGYRVITYRKDDGLQSGIKVCALIMLTFVGPRPEGQDINHLDGNKLNDALSNLEYCSRKENIDHAYQLGLAKGYWAGKSRPELSGEKAPQSKLSAADVARIRASAEGPRGTKARLARELGVSPSAISQILRGVNWKHR